MDTKKDITIKDLRVFALILSGILAVFSVKFCKTGNVFVGGIFLTISIIALIISVFAPLLIMPVYKIFLFVGKIIGSVVTTLILSIVFYCVFTPIGVILRLTKRDVLGMEIDKEKESYWVERNDRDMKPESMEKQF